ncbi:MAG: DUF2130 domain-containing protein [Chitinophagales bacterium]|nr:DUF2130 domain-containing protein [Chitinophagales bacterium]
MSDKITCPNCNYKFDVEDALSNQLKAKYQADFEQRIENQSKLFKEREVQLEAERKEFEEKKERENELFKERLEKQVLAEKEKITKEAQNKVEAELKALKEENEQRKTENRALKEKEIELLKKENALKDAAEEQKLKMEKELLEKQKLIEEKGRAKEREANALKEKEYQKQLEDQKKLIDEMKRKAEQGSMQLQGEIQELALEEVLNQTFPFDKIEEVPKGVRGADCLQRVINNLQQDCGTIVYESKRTKAFANDWIDKLKQDQINSKADIAVIVTETMPKNMERFGEMNGVWVCGFHEVKSLAFILREMLIKMQTVKSTEENKGSKMELLYSYFTSTEFKQNIKRIVENYEAMTLQLDREKRAMHKLWKEREKQIWGVQENIASLFGSIKGIAGNELDAIEILELPDADDEE